MTLAMSIVVVPRDPTNGDNFDYQPDGAIIKGTDFIAICKYNKAWFYVSQYDPHDIWLTALKVYQQKEYERDNGKPVSKVIAYYSDAKIVDWKFEESIDTNSLSSYSEEYKKQLLSIDNYGIF